MNRYDYINASDIAKWWNPTIDDLIGNWTYSRFGPHWNYTSMFEQLWQKYGRKILINIGYRNNNGTNTMPWINLPQRDLYGEVVPGHGPDVGEMTDCWEAFFRVFSTCPAIIGADLEHYTLPDSNELNGSFRDKYDNGRGLYTWQVIHNYLKRLRAID